MAKRSMVSNIQRCSVDSFTVMEKRNQKEKEKEEKQDFSDKLLMIII